VQAPHVFNDQKQADQAGPARTEEVLPVLQGPHRAPGNQVATERKPGFSVKVKDGEKDGFHFLVSGAWLLNAGQ